MKLIKVKILLLLIGKWCQSSIDEGLRVLVWVICWSLFEKMLLNTSVEIRLLVLLGILILLQRNFLRYLQAHKKPGRKHKTAAEKVIEEIKSEPTNL